MHVKKIYCGVIRVFFILILPFFLHLSAFAQNSVVNQEVSSQSFIELSGVSMNLRSFNGLRSLSKTGLQHGSVLQLPNGIEVFNQDGKTLNFNQTITQWIARSQADPNFPKALKPRFEQAPGTNSPQWYFPTKAVVSRNSTIPNGQLGYVALKFLSDNVDSSKFRVRRAPIGQVIAPPNAEGENSTGTSSSETTLSEPSTPTTPISADTTGITANDCNSSRYRTVKGGVSRLSCWKGKSMRQRAEEVLRNVLYINKNRTGAKRFNLDPRYSVCTSRKESHILPDASNGQYRGMFQVGRNETNTFVKRIGTVTPGFSGLSGSQYRTKMLHNSLAQADLHHGVVSEKARMAKLTTKINNGSATTNDYKKLARYYYYATLDGSVHAKRAATYSKKVSECYDCLKGVYTRTGGLVSNRNVDDRLKRCLNKTN